mmetsp:Transcript_60647/g.144532  ORF Transcript_60647/g.144532 Transcript_60647/m.144532 type:complete len:268 (-) Transcript_60647:229-1032(-)
MVVLVALQALDSILPREAITVQLVQDRLVQGVVLTILQAGLWYLPVPFVIANVDKSHPLLWIRGEHAGNEVHNIFADEIGNLILGIQDLLVKLSMVLVLKGQESAHQRKEDDAAAPYIHHGRKVLVARNHLWSCIAGRAARCLKKLLVLERVAETEVYYLDTFALIKKQVFGLHVSVHHVRLVDALHTRQNLVQKPTGILLLGTTVLHDVVKQLSAGRVLHDEIQLSGSLNDLVQLYDVPTTPYQLEDVNFTCNSLHISQLLDTLLL